MSKQQNSSTYVGVSGDLMLAKDPRWDINAIIAEDFDPEVFLDDWEETHDVSLHDLLRMAAMSGFYIALDEFYQFFKAFDRFPGSADSPNDDYPEKYLPRRQEV